MEAFRVEPLTPVSDPTWAGKALARAGASSDEAERILSMVFADSDNEVVTDDLDHDYSLTEALKAYACERIRAALHDTAMWRDPHGPFIEKRKP